MSHDKESVSVKILWKQAPMSGEIKVSNGALSEIAICAGDGKCETNRFSLSSEKGGIILSVNDVMIAHGSCPTIVHVGCGEPSFSFILRDALFPDNPIYIPEYGVVVSSGDDQREYDEIVATATSAEKESDFQRFEREPEESWGAAAERNRKQYCPTWLGVARDMRIFRVAQQENYGYWGEIVPAYHSKPNDINYENGAVGSIKFEIGQGDSCKVDVSRRLEDGHLPILRSIQKEGTMEYRLTLFATLENSPISSDRVRGSDFEAAYAFMGGNMLSEDERDSISELIDAETKGREEEVVCRCRVEVVNTGKTPCYAWIKTPHFFPGGAFGYEDAFDSESGFLKLKNGDARVATLVDEKPAADEEMAILTQPAKSVTVDFIIPHSPVSPERMTKMSQQSFSEHLTAAKSYWEEKLDRAAKIAVPENHIDELIRAGLLHCDIATIGKEPDDALAATIGWYSPIGTESAPIIQFYDSMGWHNEAERSIEFFLKRQKKNGFIQNFAGYESETGPLLWTMGEHFRYTRDTDWLKRVTPNIDNAVKYLLEWRKRNKTEKHRAEGCYGLVDGKVADPEDYYHQFFLNAGTYAGLKRCVEMYEAVDPAKAAKLADEVADYRRDLRDAFKKTMAEAPVVPTGDGSWAPFAPPWTDKLDSTALYIRKGNWFTHGAFTARESLVGALWLIFHEVFDADELESSFML
ncbi:MAG: hypothetical protein KAG97_00880, partial [Victivallales bacterium]|nr:hypothetical protein [Victivallales bacterium]